MNNKQLVKTLKALSNQNRLELYLEIIKKNEAQYKTREECFITDIINSFKIGTSTISHHLKELNNAGLITTEKRGKYLVAKINKNILKEVSSMLRFNP